MAEIRDYYVSPYGHSEISVPDCGREFPLAVNFDSGTNSLRVVFALPDPNFVPSRWRIEVFGLGYEGQGFINTLASQGPLSFPTYFVGSFKDTYGAQQFVFAQKIEGAG